LQEKKKDMTLIPRAVQIVFAPRRKAVEHFRRHPAEVQAAQFRRLVRQGARTAFGHDHGLAAIRSVEEFARRIPVGEYEAIKPYIDRAREGEDSVLWPGRVRWFAQSSGTTGDVSKFIPVTRDGLRLCHMRGPMDIVGLTAALWPDTKAYDGVTLTLGGSHRLDPLGRYARSGDLSSILIENTPLLGRCKRVPDVETALIPDFEKKVEQIARQTVSRRVTTFAGVPSWNLVMLHKILEITGKSNLLEIWPDLSLFVHGGMSFEPYRAEYERIIPSPRMKYLETYNASEGFFALQDDPASSDMLLMLDYGTFYEFLPVDSLGDPSKAVPLEGVKRGVNYAMIVSTVCGLWRYLIGDTVEFTSVAPYRIRITGRTRLYINAFGEEVIIDNAERAIRAASEATGAVVQDYTAGPVYMSERGKGRHEWLIEFSQAPADLEKFAETLDGALRQVNSDYAAKRYRDTTLYAPLVRPLPPGTFYRWMESRGKLGGQNKVPRLFNDRKYIDALLEMISA
jgi:hypothetical protein